MMKQHKWHKEIKAWADGTAVEARFKDQSTFKEEGFWTEWEEMDSTCRFSEDDWWEYRIKPQPKEPQYVYVYKQYGILCYEESLIESPADNIKYIGKIKLEVE